MSLAAKITAGVAAVAIAGFVALALPGCASIGEASSTVASASPTAKGTSSATATEAPMAELPAWALESVPWLVYPEGFKCTGTEGCPNDYRAAFGEPGDVLPEGVEIYDPAVHVWVYPAAQ